MTQWITRVDPGPSPDPSSRLVDLSPDTAHRRAPPRPPTDSGRCRRPEAISAPAPEDISPTAPDNLLRRPRQSPSSPSAAGRRELSKQLFYTRLASVVVASSMSSRTPSSMPSRSLSSSTCRRNMEEQEGDHQAYRSGSSSLISGAQ
ncbi:uncharacterized protein LOC123429982 [Hordeum vulgare subsp. vulgare]|uniref:uncharacterized protein LOC123429982 n=1 Tax=Hordeum vulgare subsp. vulgare TaxID=112509 RepID=UPI001D1A366F|nr:uncharacterized protein LOC123429982 [Hordeum vulgare subsp. vulgare]